MTKKVQEKNKDESEQKKIQEKNELIAKVTGKIPLQEAKNIIWDSLLVEITNFRAYLNYIKDKNTIENTDLQGGKVINESLDNNPLETTQNVITFLNISTQTYMKILRIKDRTIFIIWDRKINCKQHHVKNVQTKA